MFGMANIYFVVALLLAYHMQCIVCADKPNIVVIVADDLVNIIASYLFTWPCYHCSYWHVQLHSIRASTT